MIYNALSESRFEKCLKQIKSEADAGRVDEAAKRIPQVCDLINALPNPRDLSEKIHYLETQTRMYKKVLEIYCSCLIAPLTAGYVDDIKIVNDYTGQLSKMLGLNEMPEDFEETARALNACVEKLAEISRI